MRSGTPPHHAGATLARRLLGLVGPLALVLGVAAVLAAELAAACAPARAAAPSAPAPSIGASASPSPPGPKPTSWPTLTVEAVIALGAANGEFTKMTDDVAAALGSQDPAQILEKPSIPPSSS